MGYQ
jgi:hypothetical protein